MLSQSNELFIQTISFVLYLDIDECSTANTCPANSTCSNTVGSFMCSCDSGFVKNGDLCAGNNNNNNNIEVL